MNFVLQTTELIRHVARFLDWADLFVSLHVCSRWKTAIDTSRIIWKQVYFQHWIAGDTITRKEIQWKRECQRQKQIDENWKQIRAREFQSIIVSEEKNPPYLISVCAWKSQVRCMFIERDLKNDYICYFSTQKHNQVEKLVVEKRVKFQHLHFLDNSYFTLPVFPSDSILGNAMKKTYYLFLRKENPDIIQKSIDSKRNFALFYDPKTEFLTCGQERDVLVWKIDSKDSTPPPPIWKWQSKSNEYVMHVRSDERWIAICTRMNDGPLTKYYIHLFSLANLHLFKTFEPMSSLFTDQTGCFALYHPRVAYLSALGVVDVFDIPTQNLLCRRAIDPRELGMPMIFLTDSDLIITKQQKVLYMNFEELDSL